MNTTKVVLVSTTFSRSNDDLRFKLAIKTCEAAKTEGYPIIVVDASSEEHKAKLREHGATVHTQSVHGMGASRRQVIAAALESGAETIVWPEPEKHPLVPLLRKSIAMVAQERFDVVIPARKSLESLPEYQKLSELRTNRDLGRITGRTELDLMFGPRVMNRAAAELFAKYTGQSGGDNWEILFLGNSTEDENRLM